MISESRKFHLLRQNEFIVESIGKRGKITPYHGHIKYIKQLYIEGSGSNYKALPLGFDVVSLHVFLQIEMKLKGNRPKR